jgi:hypothetical protein
VASCGAGVPGLPVRRRAESHAILLRMVALQSARLEALLGSGWSN